MIILLELTYITDSIYLYINKIKETIKDQTNLEVKYVDKIIIWYYKHVQLKAAQLLTISTSV